MKHMQQLPIWRDANRLLLAIEQAVRHLDAGLPWPARCAQASLAQIRSRRICPRYHKYALGGDLRRQAMGVCRLIIRAYNEQHKPLQQVERLVLSLDDLKCQIQLAKELQAFVISRNFRI